MSDLFAFVFNMNFSCAAFILMTAFATVIIRFQVDYVKSETLWWVAFISVCVGHFLQLVLLVYGMSVRFSHEGMVCSGEFLVEPPEHGLVPYMLQSGAFLKTWSLLLITFYCLVLFMFFFIFVCGKNN